MTAMIETVTPAAINPDSIGLVLLTTWSMGVFIVESLRF